MSRTKRWSPLAFIGVVGIVFSACGTAATPQPSASTAPSTPTATESAAVSTAPYTGMNYPDTAIDCAKKPTGYTEK